MLQTLQAKVALKIQQGDKVLNKLCYDGTSTSHSPGTGGALDKITHNKLQHYNCFTLVGRNKMRAAFLEATERSETKSLWAIWTEV